MYLKNLVELGLNNTYDNFFVNMDNMEIESMEIEGYYEIEKRNIPMEIMNLEDLYEGILFDYLTVYSQRIKFIEKARSSKIKQNQKSHIKNENIKREYIEKFHENIFEINFNSNTHLGLLKKYDNVLLYRDPIVGWIESEKFINKIQHISIIGISVKASYVNIDQSKIYIKSLI